MAIKGFKDKVTEEIAHGKKNKKTLKLLPSEVHYQAYKKLVYLDNVVTLESLKAWSGLRLEKLSGNRKGQFSIRINEKYRICFSWDGKDLYEVEVVDYH